MAEQLAALRRKDMAAEVLWEKRKPGRFASLSGRSNVVRIPEALRGKATVVSGHHGMTCVDGDRFIIDEGAGSPHKAMEALLLPDRVVISSDKGKGARGV